MAASTQSQTQTAESYELPITSQWESSKARPQPPTPPKSQDGDDEPPANSHSTLLDRATIIKLISACFSFFVAGTNDGSVGALVPYIIRDYSVTTAIVSSVYVSGLHSCTDPSEHG